MATIGFSKATSEEKYQLYISWLRSIDTSFEVVNFYGMEIPEALLVLDRCSGLLLTGGEDVHPSLYGRGEEEHRCACDPYRDSLELALIEKALALKLPLLAICRGEQILNVSQGGDLIVDIVADFGSTVSHRSETDQLVHHHVNIDKSSNLYRVGKVTTAEIVTIHHQAVKRLAGCFLPTAFAYDGILEAYLEGKVRLCDICYSWTHLAGHFSLTPR